MNLQSEIDSRKDLTIDFFMAFYNIKDMHFQNQLIVHVNMVMHPFQLDQVDLADHEDHVVLLDLLHPKLLIVIRIIRANTCQKHTFSPFSPGGP